MYTAPPPPLHSNDETQDKAKQEVEKEKSDEKVSTLKDSGFKDPLFCNYWLNPFDIALTLFSAEFVVFL